MKRHNRSFNPYLLCLGLTVETFTVLLLKTPAKAIEVSSQIQPTAIAELDQNSSGKPLSIDSISTSSTNAEVVFDTAASTSFNNANQVTSSQLVSDATPIAPVEQKLENTETIAPVTPTTQPETAIPATSNTPNDTIAPTANPETQLTANPVPIAPLAPGEIRILTPTTNAVLDIPAATVILQYAEGSQVEVKVNGVVVPADLAGRTETDTQARIVTQTLYGVALKEGINTLTAQAVLNGQAGTIASVQVQVRGEAQQLKIETVEAKIPADGRSTATIQGHLLDAQGNRSSRDAVITLVSNAGEFAGADFNLDQTGFQVQAKQGQFTANLRSGLEAKTATIRATANTLEAFTQIEFIPNLRPSIATGVIDIRLGRRGTNFYDRFENFLPADGKYGTTLEARGAVFATGRIGEWLFTGAYNSERPLNESCDGTNSLFRAGQDCDQNYPVYGDSSESSVLAPSIDHFYARIERNSPVAGAGIDYAMWGDYNTEEFATRSQEFTATTRQLHGFKANYNLGNLQITGFFANNVEGFQRDTVAPDGTSGYYFLSRRLLVEGSENVFLELEELNRPGTVLDRRQLSRGADYEIDYDRGTLLFRRPILRTDIGENGETLVRRIVVTYQYDSPGSDNHMFGGRLQYHLSRELNRESWIGATYLRETQGVRDFELYGADAYISLGSKAHLIAEYAHSMNESDVLGRVGGSAYRLEVEGEIAEGIFGRAYYRSADSGFSNNATVSFVPGQTRYGAQVSARVSRTTNLRFQYDHEVNKGVAPRQLTTFEDLFNPRTEALPGIEVDNSLTTISAGIQQKIGSADLTVDWIHRDRKDHLNPELDAVSDQLRSRLTVPLAKKLTLIAQNEMTFSSEEDALYPDRTLLGLNWEVMKGINVQLAHQFFTGGQYDGQSITSLNVNGEYKIGSGTTIHGRMGILGGANGMTTQGAIGIDQQITLAPGLRMDLAYEHIFGNFVGRTGAGNQFLQPFAPGQSASSIGVESGDSYSIGLSYTDNPDFQASARFEHRHSSSGSNTVISAAATGKLSPSLTALFRYQQANYSNQKLSGLGDTVNLKLGLAYRNPNDDKFNALLRYEYRKNPSIIPEALEIGEGTGSKEHLFAAEAIYAPNWRWEFYGKFALRHSTSYIAEDFTKSSMVTLAQARATYRIGYKWDVVGEARWINQPSEGFSETGFVVEAGYYLTPNLRIAAGYSFGRVNDRDFDGSRSAGGPYIGVTVKLNELFSGFGLQKVAPPQQQESEKQPVAAVPANPAAIAEANNTGIAPATTLANPGKATITEALSSNPVNPELVLDNPSIKPQADTGAVPGMVSTSAASLLQVDYPSTTFSEAP
jgi:hypothetical protein